MIRAARIGLIEQCHAEGTKTGMGPRISGGPTSVSDIIVVERPFEIENKDAIGAAADALFDACKELVIPRLSRTSNVISGEPSATGMVHPPAGAGRRTSTRSAMIWKSAMLWASNGTCSTDAVAAIARST